MSQSERPEDPPGGNTDLRSMAEERLARSPGEAAELRAKASEEIVHELQVHQIELEMQNEELNRAYLALEESRDRYLDLYDFAPVGYLSLTRAGRIVEVNLTGATLLGVPRTKLVHRGLGSFVAPEDLEQWDCHLASVAQSPEKQICELAFQREDGSPFQVRLESTRQDLSQEDAGGSSDVPAVRTALIDITDRKRAEEEREKVEIQLREAQKLEAVGHLAGGVAHQFNNLLQAILGNLEFVQSDLDSGSENWQDLDDVRKAAQRAADLTRQLLAFSQRQMMQPVHLDPNDLVQGVLKRICSLTGESIRLCFMPGGHVDMIRADRGHMEQVLLDLCVNARDAMPGGGTLTIQTKSVLLDKEYCRDHPWAAEGRYALLRVMDTGRGMDEATRARIFEPFFTTKDVGQGTGLGLASVYGIVKQHNGFMYVDSEPGKGTTFGVHIPCAEQTVSEGAGSGQFR